MKKNKTEIYTLVNEEYLQRKAENLTSISKEDML